MSYYAHSFLSQTDRYPRPTFSAVDGSRVVSNVQNVVISINRLRRSSSICHGSEICHPRCV